MATNSRELAQNSRELAQRPAVDPEDEPSAEWGWHGEFKLVTPAVGIASALLILALLIGNHEGRVEDLWIVGIGLAMLFMVVRATLKSRNAWRR